MDIDRARSVLILSSLIITGLQIVFLIAAPVFGFPLPYPGNLHVLQIISPVFLGYLGSASHFIFQDPAPVVPVQKRFLGTLVVGPIVIYACSIITAFAVFAWSNRADAPPGTGISEDDLSTILSLALGVLAVTTGVITSYLFVAPKEKSNTPT